MFCNGGIMNEKSFGVSEMKSPTISILISMCGGRERHFAMSLDSITRQRFDRDQIELVVVLDFPNPRKALSILKKKSKYFNSIRCYIIDRNNPTISHSATFRNFLATKAKGEYILFSEPEMLHIGSTLSPLFRFLSRKPSKFWYCGPVFATASVVDNKGKIIVDDYDGTENVNFLLSLASRYQNDFSNSKMKKYFFKIDRKNYPFSFFCVLFSRKFFFQLGGLNQNLKVRGWEEIEFFERFSNKGGKINFDRNFVTCHLPHKRRLYLTDQVGWDLYNSTVLFNPSQKIGEILQKIEEVVFP